MSPLRVLITNITLATRTGTEFFVRDLAHGLKEAGHLPMVYTPAPGSVADEIRAEGIAVTDDLTRLPERPDIIHGHHTLQTMEAVVRFPGVPAIFVAHDRLVWHDAPPLHPRIRRHVAVDYNCLDRLTIDAKIAADRTCVIQNAVDLRKFRPRDPLPPRPRRALLFSNYATEEGVAGAVRDACARSGIALDVAGQRLGSVCEHPESVLGGYDLVFGKARCALEALAVGCAVVVCDFRGVGGLVTPVDFTRMRRLNFGMRLLVEPVSAEVIAREIGRYDPAACTEVSAAARRDASLEGQVAQFVRLYHDVLAEPAPTGSEAEAVGRYLASLMPACTEIAVRAGDGLAGSVIHPRANPAPDERAALEAQIDAIRNSAAMRVRDRLLSMPGVGPVALYLARWLSGKHASTGLRHPMPVIVGVPRSGTTLLRFMLDAHPLLAIPPETGWLPEVAKMKPTGNGPEALLKTIADPPNWSDFKLTRGALEAALRAVRPFTISDGVRAFYRLYALRFDKPRWGEKTPGYGLHMLGIERVLPESHFIHLIRDGRDVAASVRGLPFAPGNTMESIANDWCRRIRETRAQARRCRRYLEIRYEDLILKPAETVQSVCTFIDLVYDPAMLEYYRRSRGRLMEHEAGVAPDGRPITKQERIENQRFTMQPPDAARIGRWRQALSAQEIAEFERVAGPLLRELEYAR